MSEAKHELCAICGKELPVVMVGDIRTPVWHTDCQLAEYKRQIQVITADNVRLRGALVKVRELISNQDECDLSTCKPECYNGTLVCGEIALTINGTLSTPPNGELSDLVKAVGEFIIAHRDAQVTGSDASGQVITAVLGKIENLREAYAKVVCK